MNDINISTGTSLRLSGEYICEGIIESGAMIINWEVILTSTVIAAAVSLLTNIVVSKINNNAMLVRKSAEFRYAKLYEIICLPRDNTPS